MKYLIFFTPLIFISGLISYISSNSEINPDVRKNLAPEDIESITRELTARAEWGVLLMLIAMFPVMIYLCLFY